MQNTTVIQSSSVQPSTSYEPAAVVVSSAPQQGHQTLPYMSSPPAPVVRSNILEVNTDANGGTVLIVNLPPAHQSGQVCHPSPALSQASSVQSAAIRPPSVTIQQIQPRPSPPPAQQVHVQEVCIFTNVPIDSLFSFKCLQFFFNFVSCFMIAAVTFGRGRMFNML